VNGRADGRLIAKVDADDGFTSVDEFEFLVVGTFSARFAGSGSSV
jgi:hypothetical protein